MVLVVFGGETELVSGVYSGVDFGVAAVGGMPAGYVRGFREVYQRWSCCVRYWAG